METMLGRRVEHHSPARLSSRKAGEMLEHGTVHGKPLSPKQKKLFRAVEHGWRPTRLK
jgi:hypothetical protein